MRNRTSLRLILLLLVILALLWRERDELGLAKFFGSSSPPVPGPEAVVSQAQKPEPPPAPPQLPPLPERQVTPLPQHKVPEEDVAEVVQPLDMRNKLAAEQAGGRVEARQARSPANSASLPAVKQLSGNAEAAGASALSLSGRRLSLFGVRPPEGSDRCAPAKAQAGAPSPAQSCSETARITLADHLRAAVSCRFPMPSAGATGAAICLDGQGNDLGGLLVSEGLALADRSQSFDYVGAEQIARNQKRGLWSFR